MRRFFDVLFSGLALLVLSPLLVPIAWCCLDLPVKVEVFFLQERVGKDGKPFKLLQVCHHAEEQSQHRHWHGHDEG
jgi:lipopolysaccharide/colanic/teichoic acid biosynthesis glycosyltransferase